MAVMMMPVMMMVVPVAVVPTNVVVTVPTVVMAVHVPVMPVLHFGRLRDGVPLDRGGDARGRQRRRLGAFAGGSDQQQTGDRSQARPFQNLHPTTPWLATRVRPLAGGRRAARHDPLTIRLTRTT